MSCPRFITDDIGFCGEADFMYIPSIAEMEQFCFTRKFGACRLFGNREGTVETEGSKYSRPVPDLVIGGPKATANRFLPK